MNFCRDELALLDAIHANPRDDTIRLIYADWLQENGQEEYAEFIRLQIERAAAGVDHPSKRESQLLRSSRRRWEKPFPPSQQRGHYHRGLPYVLRSGEDLIRPSGLERYNPRLRVDLRLAAWYGPGDNRFMNTREHHDIANDWLQKLGTVVLSPDPASEALNGRDLEQLMRFLDLRHVERVVLIRVFSFTWEEWQPVFQLKAPTVCMNAVSFPPSLSRPLPARIV